MILLSRRKIVFLALLVLLATAGLTGNANAQTDSGVNIIAHAGLDGFCKPGMWIPVHITAQNMGPDVEARVQAAYQNDLGGTSIFGADVSLPTTSRKDFFLYAYPTSAARTFTVSVLDGKTILAQKFVNASCASSSFTLFGVLSDNSSAYDLLRDVRPLSGVTQVAQLTVDDLPDRAQGWEAMDALIIANVDTGTLSTEQKQAMELWLARGGKLFVAGGVNWQMTTAGLDGILPIQLDSTKQAAGLSALSSHLQDESLPEG
ncbi:MAG: hypothetical protein HYZ23_08275, partial [Chloroflexi bacterium]|nr:hypothetical protein [Chloroflexota bacterium]